MVLFVSRRRKRIDSKNLFYDVLSCHWLLLYVPFIISVSSVPSLDIGSSTVTAFTKHKFGNIHHDVSPAAIWVYTGILIDPVTGADVCNVEGIELIQSIGHVRMNETNSATDDQSFIPFSRFRRRCRNLRVFQAMEQSSDLPRLECHTFLSRKCFCYISRDKKQLLQSLRRRYNGPNVQVPFHQAVSCFDSVISCIGHHATPNKSTSPATWLHTEQPNSKAIWSRMVSSLQKRSLDEESPAAPLDFSIFVRRRSPPLRIDGALDQSEPQPGKNATDSVHRPNRLQLIQFGSSQQPSGGNDFGARETYQYTSSSMQPDKAVVRYTRHGEAPVWYGPGRMCQLELTGRRIDPMATVASQHPVWKRFPWNRAHTVTDEFHWNVEDVSNDVPVIFNVIQRNIPRFWEFGVSTKPKMIPEWKQSLYAAAETIQRSPKSVARDFLYYANALHTELQRDIDGLSPNNNFETPSQPLLSEIDYRQIYSDLSVGRQVNRFLQQPLKLSQQPLMNPHLDQVYHKLSSVWDKIRAASTLSIGAQHDLHGVRTD